MRSIQLFKTKKEYEDFVFGKMFKEKLISEHPFYRNLIQFIIDSKAPIFYYQSDPAEHANFSNYYNFQLIRETYETPTMESMFFLHDFTHMLFYYPHNMARVGEKEFGEIIIANEYAASNESEILLHYRIPGIRAKVFRDKRIFADILKEQGIPQPEARTLFEMRKAVIESDMLDSILFKKPEDQPVKDHLKGYSEENRAWYKKRYAELLKINRYPAEYSYKFFTPQTYERVIKDYTRIDSQPEYERLVLQNMRLMCEVLGLDTIPATFEECFSLAALLEGRVMLQAQTNEKI